MKTNLKLLLLLVLSTAASHQATTQNAKDWKAITVPMQQVDNLYFWHADSGFALDKLSNILYKTTDGGNTWKVLYEFKGQGWPWGPNLLNIIDKNIIYYTYPRLNPNNPSTTSHKWFYRSYDGGQTWEEKVDSIPGLPPYADYYSYMNCLSKDTCIFVTSTYTGPGSVTHKWYSLDGGRTLHLLFTSGAYGNRMGNWFFGGYIIPGTGGPQPKQACVLYNGWDSMVANIGRTVSNEYLTKPYSYDGTPVDENWWKRIWLDYTKDGCNTFDSITPNYFDAYIAGKKQRDPGFGNEIMQVRQLDINYYLVDLKRWYLENTGFGLSNKCHAILDSNTAIIGTSTNIILKTSNRGGLDSTRRALSTGMQQQARQERMKVKVYPNPASSQLSIEVLNAQGFEISLTNLEGKTVKAGNVTAASITLNTSDLARGMYLLRVISPTGGLSVHKVLLR